MDYLDYELQQYQADQDATCDTCGSASWRSTILVPVMKMLFNKLTTNNNDTN